MKFLNDERKNCQHIKYQISTTKLLRPDRLQSTINSSECSILCFTYRVIYSIINKDFCTEDLGYKNRLSMESKLFYLVLQSSNKVNTFMVFRFNVTLQNIVFYRRPANYARIFLILLMAVARRRTKIFIRRAE